MFLIISLVMHHVNVHEMMVLLLWWKLWLCCRIFVANRVAKCDNKVTTPFVVTFSLPIPEKNATTIQNVEVADAYGTHSATITIPSSKRKQNEVRQKNIITINQIANSPVLQSPTVACLKLEYKNKRASLSGLLFSFFTSSAAFVNSWNRNMHYVDLYTMSTCSSPSFSHLKIKETFQAWASTFLSAILFLPTFKKF